MARTLGPWEFFRGVVFRETNDVHAACDDVVCELTRRDEDGHLIAAAPELLEALEDMVHHYRNYNPRKQERAEILKALAAIKKAKGQSA